MSIDAIKMGFPGIAPIKPSIAQGDQAKSSGGFDEVLTKAIKEVDSLQSEANQKIEDVTLRKDGANSHEAYLALEKADVAFQLMNTIRGKIVRAYEEVMRTQV